MGKKNRKGGGKSGRAREFDSDEYDSDDERTYSKEKIPDPKSSSYYHDEVDEFHSNRAKILLEKGISQEPTTQRSNEQEVFALYDDDEDEDDRIEEYERRLRNLRSQPGMIDDNASDFDDDDLTKDDAGGVPIIKRKSMFYGADVTDDAEIDESGSEPDTALMEEQEALLIQRRMAEQLDDEDFGLDGVLTAAKPDDQTETEKELVIKKDLSKLSKKEKLQLIKAESPELLFLIDDYKAKMSELSDVLLPLVDCVNKRLLSATRELVEFVHERIRLYLDYCININFYLVLKAKRESITNHPVISRILQFRNLMKQLASVDERFRSETETLVKRLKRGNLTTIPEQPCDLQNDLDVKINLSKGRLNKRKVPASMDKKSTQIDLPQVVSDSDDDVLAEQASVDKGGRTWGRKKQKVDDPKYQTKAELAALEYYEMMKAGRKPKSSTTDTPATITALQPDRVRTTEGSRDEEGWEGDYAEEGGRRAIDYTIAKNRGLTPHRKKEYRNPRVKHRMKFRKALIRRKGQHREVRKETERYGGELSGIRAGVKRSVKLK